jgi:uridine kinase
VTRQRTRCLNTLVEAILAVRVPHPVRVAIDGPDAAGKTVLADEMAPLIERAGRPVVRASIDGFHNPRAQRWARGAESPEGYYFDSFDYRALRESLLKPLGAGGNRRIRRRVFDFRTDEPAYSRLETAPREAVLLFDGVFLLRQELDGLWDFSLFVDAPFRETLQRAAIRDAAMFGSEATVIRRYAARYVPGQQIYYETERPQSRASVVMDNADPDRPKLTFLRQDVSR